MNKSSEYYGSVQGMPEEILTARLATAKADLESLTAELARRQAFTPQEILADRIHRLIHFGADCDYYYSNWPNPSGCRSVFRLAADEILQDPTSETAIGVLERLRFGK